MTDQEATAAQRHTLHTGELVLHLAADTQVGTRYQENFDILAVEPGRPVVAVIDGMGAGEGSALAGRTTAETFLAQVSQITGAVGPAALRAAVAQVQWRVRKAGARLRQRSSLLTGCTLTALVADGDTAWIVHIGDSRVYRLRPDGVLELLTSDHTEAWLGLLHGWYPADSPAADAARYRLHRYVGHPAEPEPDLLHVALRPGDVLCLCTDGVSEQVPYQRLAQLLSGGDDPAEVVSALLTDTLAAGGRDNATVAVLAVTSPAF